jgi:hypothetical protein
VTLYEHVAALHGDAPWARLLDAGTGPGSLRWLLDLPTESWTAVTASPAMAGRMRTLAGDRTRESDRLLVGCARRRAAHRSPGGGQAQRRPAAWP